MVGQLGGPGPVGPDGPVGPAGYAGDYGVQGAPGEKGFRVSKPSKGSLMIVLSSVFLIDVIRVDPVRPACVASPGAMAILVRKVFRDRTALTVVMECRERRAIAVSRVVWAIPV